MPGLDRGVLNAEIGRFSSSRFARRVLASLIWSLAAVSLMCFGDRASFVHAEVAGRVVRLAATGDLLLHRSVVESAAAHRAQGGWSWVLGGLCGAIRDDEVGVLNVESPLTQSVVRPRRGDHPVLGAPPEVAAALARCGVRVGAVANNHALDQDSEGLARTVAALERAGVLPVGAGATEAEALRAKVLHAGGMTVAFLAATGPMNQRPRGHGAPLSVVRLRHVDQIEQAIAEARRDGADIVVVLLHWMWDYRRGPRRYERSLARRLIDSGADIILGTGPHLLHPVERLPSPRGQALVAWSLGNLVSGMGMRWRPGFHPPSSMHPVSILPGTRDAVVLHLSVAMAPEGRVSFPTLRATPLWTENDWLSRRSPNEPPSIRVVPLANVAPEIRALRQRAIAEALGPEVELEHPEVAVERGER